ncbi:calcium ion-binding protein [Trifolium repens]|nr:calcium ion-binding protein [Trifolium repens]
MGQSLKKLTPGIDEKKAKELGPIIDEFYDKNIKNSSDDFPKFYRGVCEIVEELNRKLGYTQFKLPKPEDLKRAYEEHHKVKDRKLTKAEFQEIMKEMIKESRFTGVGAKEALLYIFGVPVTALFVKQRVMPQAIPNEFFIPGITSLTVLILAALNKI